MNAFQIALTALIDAGRPTTQAEAMLQAVIEEALAPSPGAIRQRRWRERRASPRDARASPRDARASPRDASPRDGEPKKNQQKQRKTSAGANGFPHTPFQAPPSEAVREGKEELACGAKEGNRARELRDDRLRSGKFDRRDTYYEVDGVAFTFGDILDLNAKCRHIGNPAGMLMHMTESREWDTCAPWERKRFAISAVLRKDRQIGDKQTRPKAEIKQLSERDAIRAEVQAQWDKYHGPAH